MTDPVDLEASFASNQRLWDAWTKVHAEGEFYDVAGFREGGLRLRPYEVAALGDVTGKTLLHLNATSGSTPCPGPDWREGHRRRPLTCLDRAGARAGADIGSRMRASSNRTSTSCQSGSATSSTSCTHHAACSAGCPTSVAGARVGRVSSSPAAGSTSPRSTRSCRSSKTGRVPARAAPPVPVLGARQPPDLRRPRVLRRPDADLGTETRSMAGTTAWAKSSRR